MKRWMSDPQGVWGAPKDSGVTGSLKPVEMRISGMQNLGNCHNDV